MQLHVAERLFRVYVAGAGCNLEVTVRHFPRGGTAVLAFPTGKILSVEQHHGVRWRCSNAMLSARSARRYFARLGRERSPVFHLITGTETDASAATAQNARAGMTK